MEQVQLPRSVRFAVALLGVLGLTAVLLLVRPFAETSNLVLAYVPLVLIVAIRYGRAAAGVASLLAFLAFNFLFVPPLYTLTVEQPQDLIELVIFLAIALIVGTLAARERSLKLAALQQAEQMTALYKLSQEVSAVRDGEQLLPTIARASRRILGADGVVIRLAGTNGAPPAAQDGVVGGAPTLVPIMNGAEQLGHIEIYGAPALSADDPLRSTLLATIANQIALMVERSRAAKAAIQTRSLREADRLKNALLSSVSHDLRTPLAAIKGAASNLVDPEMHWDEATRAAFATTILQESDRLNRFVRNLLEMSRLEGGAVRRQHRPEDIGDVIGTAVQRLQPVLAGHPLRVTLPDDLPAVPMDAVQIDLVLTNLLENAAKFAPAGSPILIAAERRGDAIVTSVADSGPGIPPGELARIFGKFYRLARPEYGPGGTGLGLAICLGIVQAHEGRIWAENRAEGGAVFRFTLPLHPVSEPSPAQMEQLA